MAYLKKNAIKTEKEIKWTGPFPNKVGEWFINHPNGYKITQSNVRLGKPRSCLNLPSFKLERMGFSGLFLTEDIPILGDPLMVVEIDTDLLHEEVVSDQRPANKGIDPKYVMEK